MEIPVPASVASHPPKPWSACTLDELIEQREYWEFVEMNAASPYTVMAAQAFIKGCDNWIACRKWQRDYNERWAARRGRAELLDRSEERIDPDCHNLVPDHPASVEVLVAHE